MGLQVSLAFVRRDWNPCRLFQGYGKADGRLNHDCNEVTLNEEYYNEIAENRYANPSKTKWYLLFYAGRNSHKVSVSVDFSRSHTILLTYRIHSHSIDSLGQVHSPHCGEPPSPRLG